MNAVATNNYLLIAFIGLSLYNMGNMMSLQLQHYSLYPLIEPNNFVKYISGNNKAAVIPAIVPALISLMISILLVWMKPDSVPNWFAYLGLAMNLVVLASTIIWQARIQGGLAQTGFDAAKIQTLITTNWIRTIAYSIQGLSSLCLLNKLIS
jgi:hypothetical protein